MDISIAKQKVKKWIHDFVNQNSVAKFLAILIIWGIGLIPAWLYLLTRWLADPIGFWQELALFLVFVVFLGWLQAIALIFMVALTFNIMLDSW